MQSEVTSAKRISVSDVLAAAPSVSDGSPSGRMPQTHPSSIPFAPAKAAFEVMQSRDTASWNPTFSSPDRAINGVKAKLDAFGLDQVRNDGYAQGAVNVHRDSIVGSQYIVNSKPNWRVLMGMYGGSEDTWRTWAEAFQLAAESRFNLLAESPNCWLDASGLQTFTGMMRLAVAGAVYTGEVCVANEWDNKDRSRPCKTNFLLFSPDRLSNPMNRPDEQFLRRGIRINAKGKPQGYYIRNGHPGARYETLREDDWRYVPATKPWGRRLICHVYEPMQVEQSRGIADMVSVLRRMSMAKKWSDTQLEKEVLGASYAAAVESELPSDVLAAAMGGPGGTGADPSAAMMKFYQSYMGGLASFLDNSNKISVNGVRIPHFFPGTKLVAKPLGAGSAPGSEFEASMLRHIAAGLGVSYEELAHDYSRTSYSSIRASVTNTGKFMAGRKKAVADRVADNVYWCWAEEDVVSGYLPLPPGVTLRDFYNMPLVKEAMFSCEWIGSGKGQIDEMKETQAAMMRVKAGFSTQEAECARLGLDWRDVVEQLAREAKRRKELGVVSDLDATKTNAAGKSLLEDDGADDQTQQQQEKNK